MAIEAIAGRLAGLEIFRGLTATLLERIAREADRIVYKAGQHLSEAGSEADAAIVIIGGTAEIVADTSGPVEPKRIVAGTMIGELAMLIEHRTTVTVIAADTVRAIKISRDMIHAVMQDDRNVLQHFEARMTARLSRVALELKLVDQRLAAASG